MMILCITFFSFIRIENFRDINVELMRLYLIISMIGVTLRFRCCYGSTEELEITPEKYTIGALLPIHRFGESKNNKLCDDSIQEYGGFQLAEAFYLALDNINSDPKILPNVTLEVNILDYCSSTVLTWIQMAKLMQNMYFQDGSKNQSSVIGIVLPKLTNLQECLPLFDAPKISYEGPLNNVYGDDSGDVLNNYFNINSFVSVTSGNYFMAEVILEILKYYNWSHISLLYEHGPISNDQNRLEMRRFLKLAPAKGICVENVIEVGDFSRLNASFRETVDVVVCYCNDFLLSTQYKNKKFVVIKGNGKFWSGGSKNEGEIMLGDFAIALRPQLEKQFDEYYLSRNLLNNQRNPWVKEFWQKHFKCEINPGEDSNSTKCSGVEKLNRTEYKQNPHVHNIMKSVYFLAHNLQKYQNKYRDKMKKSSFSSNSLFDNLNFEYHNEVVSFTSHATFPKQAKYDIYNFQRLSNGSYDYVKIGEYDLENEKKKFRIFGDVQFPQNKTTFRASCAEPCPLGYAKKKLENKCCWECVACQFLEIVTSSSFCQKCPLGYMPNENRTDCIEAPVESARWNDIHSLIATGFSSFCIILITLIICIFIKHQNTPVVKSTTKELCYIMFGGMIFANATPFISILMPDPITCAAFRIVPAISSAMIYASLLIKTNRIARILAISKKKFPNMNLRFLSIQAQLIITSLLITIEVVICIISLSKHPPEPETEYFETSDTYSGIEICPLEEDIIIEIFWFIAFLVFCCTYYAYKTRNLPENFNEAKYIGFSMYATILTGVAFGLVYFTSEKKALAVNLCVSINSLIILVFLFSPKLYIIIWKPEKNTRAYFKTSDNIRTHVGIVESTESRQMSSSSGL